MDSGRGVCCLLLCLCVFTTQLRLTHAYYVRYLNVTAATVLNNRRLLQRYVMCLAGEGPCPPQARDIKKLMPELVSSKCSKCDVRLRQVFERCRQLLEYNYPSKWTAMVNPKPRPNAL